MKYYKIKDVFVAEVFAISRRDNLVDILFYSDLLILIRENDRYYDLFSKKEFIDRKDKHFMDDVFYIKNMDELMYPDHVTSKELISGLISEDRLKYLSNKVNDGTYTRKRSRK